MAHLNHAAKICSLFKKYRHIRIFREKRTKLNNNCRNPKCAEQLAAAKERLGPDVYNYIVVHKSQKFMVVRAKNPIRPEYGYTPISHPMRKQFCFLFLCIAGQSVEFLD